MFDVKATTSKASADCGAACMVSLLDYYGISVTLEEMVKDCNVKVSGSTGKDLMVAGRKHGLDMTAWKEIGRDEDAPEGARVIDVAILDQDRPSIVWWKYNHWVICCGVDDTTGKVVVMNPTRGRYGVSKSLFNAFYSGVSICNGVPQELPEE